MKGMAFDVYSPLFWIDPRKISFFDSMGFLSTLLFETNDWSIGL